MRIMKRFFLMVLFLFLMLTLSAQEFSKSDVGIVTRPSPHNGRFRVTMIENKFNQKIVVTVINEYDKGKTDITLDPGQKMQTDWTCSVVKAKPVGGRYIEICGSTLEEPDNKPVESETAKKERESDSILKSNEMFIAFSHHLQTISFYSPVVFEKDSTSISSHINNLQQSWTDKKAYIQANNLRSYIATQRDSMNLYAGQDSAIIYSFLMKNRKLIMNNEVIYADSMKTILAGKRVQRDSLLSNLEVLINNSKSEETGGKDFDWKVVIVCGLLFLLFLGLSFWYRKAKSKDRKETAHVDASPNSELEEETTIIVRNMSSAMLKKQNMDDVYDNGIYLKIDTKDFCVDSAVRSIYIKNTCIMDIYTMYAEDLRNPDNPKEDGCMVLGRWIYDKAEMLYDVSLEEIILPGDDAIFEEYELNFGGKIKLKMSERLRKLRRETDLQYDLTCWVHSHPGLGVFFSNSDSNVHIQLKHHAHPKFLVAMVIDILTPEQQLGIFTFRNDETINSKNDLTKLYSLEEMYNWAVESNRNSYKKEDYFNTLSCAKSHHDECFGIELSNGAVIDMTFLAPENGNGIVGLASGYALEEAGKTTYIVNKFSKGDDVSDEDMIGCFIIAPHCSIPTIRKVLSHLIEKIHFVIVYTTADGLLTSVPVVNQDLLGAEDYYGEQKLEHLKIWTRRKR